MKQDCQDTESFVRDGCFVIKTFLSQPNTCTAGRNLEHDVACANSEGVAAGGVNNAKARPQDMLKPRLPWFRPSVDYASLITGGRESSSNTWHEKLS